MMKEEIKKVKLSKKVSIFSDGTVSGTNIFTENGYEYFIFEGKRVAVHRIIAQYFLNQGNSIEGLDVHHIDFSRNNNNVNNLLILTKQRHCALHRYLETPEGYRKLQEDIQIWKDKAEYYRKKAQRIENLNIKMEKVISEQNDMIVKMNKFFEILNNTINNTIIHCNELEIKMKQIDDITKNIQTSTNKTTAGEIISGEKNIKAVITKCMDKYGKVTRKSLRLMGVRNYDSVYHLYFANKDKYINNL